MISNTECAKAIDLLNSSQNDKDNYIAALRSLDDIFNTLSFRRDDKARDIYSNLTENGKKKFLAIWSLTGIELAYVWIARGFDSWDDRKKASQQFAFKHRFTIEEIFKNSTGYILDTSKETTDTTSDTFFPTWCKRNIRKQVNEENHEEIFKFDRLAFEISSMHSTIKQSFFGGTVKGVIIPEHLIEDEDCYFPFI